MRNKAWLFLGCLVVFSGIGALLRAIELRTALDPSTMLMDMVPASILLLVLSALVLGLTGLFARKSAPEELPRRYNRCFGGVGSLAVGAAALILAALGALSCLRERNSVWDMRLFLGLLALMGFLAGAAWLALGLDGWRKKKEDSFLSAVLPVIFCGTFLVLFYKTYAQLPALLYILYPFLGLCAAVIGLHLIAGFSLGRLRARLTLFFCGAGAYLCIVSLPGVKDVSFQLFLGAIALELAAHGVCLLLPHPPEPEQEEAETPKEDGEAEAEKAPETPEAPEAPETPEAEAPEGEAGGENA
jgi:ABC-type Na+ efflux pump permease subunit